MYQKREIPAIPPISNEIETSTDLEERELLLRCLRRLMMKVNPITARFRHGQLELVSERVYEELTLRQIEIEDELKGKKIDLYA